MQIEKVVIRNFRSIDHCELSGCGGFNVLIGKNNSGKSNLLSAIHAFWEGISAANVVTLDTPIRGDIDFFERNGSEPIVIDLVLGISSSDRQSLFLIV